MAGSFTAVDLSALPPPTVVETLSFETIFQEMLSDLIARDPTFSALVESDPAYKILQVCAYREVLIRQRVNDAAYAVMLAYATGADLDQIAANYKVERLMIDAGDPDAVPPVDPTYESDTELRRRVQLSLESYTTAGSIGSYIFHALSADADCKDVSLPDEPITPGTVNVAVLSRTGDGTAPPETLEAVEAALTAEEVRPLCDRVLVESASIVNYAIEAELTFFPGVGKTQVLAAAQAAAEAYASDMHALGLDITRSGIFAALHQTGVQNVVLASPAADIVNEWNEAPYCTGITLTDGGTGE